MVVIAVIGFQLLVVQVEAGENLVFFEDEVRDHGFLRASAQIQGAQLLEAANQESKLCLKAGPRFAFVKGAEERIVLRLHDLLRVETLRQNSRQSAFADAYGAFHCDVSGQLKKIGHGSGEIGNRLQHILLRVTRQLRKRLTAETQGNI